MLSGKRWGCRRSGREKRSAHHSSLTSWFAGARKKKPRLCNILASASVASFTSQDGSTDAFRDIELPLPLLPVRPLVPLPSRLLPLVLATARFRESISFCAPVIIAVLKSSDAMSMGMRCELKYDASCILAVFSIKSPGLLCTMTARV